MALIQVEENILNQTISYMASKPFSEVNQLINALLTNARRVEEIPAAQETAPVAEQPAEG